MKSITSVVAMLSGILLLSACSSNEIGESKDVAQEKIYQSHSFSYTEGDADVKLVSQFRFGGKNGTTLVLNAPSAVQLDGTKLTVDSSDALGAFYQATKPANSFFGKHLVVFTNTEGKNIENNFTFDPFKLVNVPASVSKKQSFTINFESGTFDGDDYVEIAATNTDSSFSITHNLNNGGNTITIPAKELQRQTGNELTLQATLYQNLSLQQNTAEGGRIGVEYNLKPVKIKLTN